LNNNDDDLLEKDEEVDIPIISGKVAIKYFN
jgi:hypothetical protein